MKIFLLDVADAGMVFFGIGALILAFVLTILIEALILLALKYNKFGRSFRDSAIINIASILLGFALQVGYGEGIFQYDVKGLLIMWGITVVIEGILLYLLNRSKPIGKTIVASLLINLVTYILLSLLIAAI